MKRRRLILLGIGACLITLGACLIVYGSSLPADFVVHGIWNFSRQDETNILMLFGALMVPLGVSFLLFWFFTRRSKPASNCTY